MLETQQSAATFGTHEQSDPSTASTVRLVIRARILSDNPPPRHEHPISVPRVALAGVALLLLIAIAVGLIRHSSQIASTNTSKAPSIPSSSAPMAVEPPKPAAAPIIEPKPDPNTVVDEVLPTVSRGSLQTIHGTIKVVIRVLVNQDGTVRAASSHITGPSRYFERVALQSAKKWQFGPTDAEESRTFLVHFDFTRNGVTGGAAPLD